MAGSDGKPRGMKEYVDGLERRVAAMEKRMVVAVSLELERRVERLERDFSEHIHHTVSQDHVSGPVLPDGVIGPGYHPLPETPGMPAGEKIYGPRPAEPPGSPTVEEDEDRPRSECWEVRNKDGIVINHYKTDPGEMAQGRTKHRMVELRDREGIHDVMWVVGLVNENDALKELGAHKEKAIELLSAKLKEAQADSDQRQARVKELASENDSLRTELQGCALLAKEYSEKIAAFSENLCSRHLEKEDTDG